jgi:hypothetical protein
MQLAKETTIDYNFLVTNTDLLSETNKYHDIFQQKYDDIVKSVQVNSYQGIHEDLVVNFIKKILIFENFENEGEFIQVYERKLKEITRNIIEKNISDKGSDLWSDIVRFAFEHNGVLYFYEINLTHNEKTKNFSFFIKKLNAAISFFEDFMIFKTSDQINYDLGYDKNELLLIFEVILIAKTDNATLKKDSNISNITNFKEYLQSALKQAKSINKNIINTIHSEFESLTNTKVDNLYKNAISDHMNKISEEGYLTYIERMSRRIGISEDGIKVLIDSCSMTKDEVSDEWNAFHIASDNKLASFLISRNENNTFNVYFVNVDSPITIEEGFAVRKQNLKSIEGEILFNSILSDNEMKNVFDFLNALTIRKVYENIIN